MGGAWPALYYCLSNRCCRYRRGVDPRHISCSPRPRTGLKPRSQERHNLPSKRIAIAGLGEIGKTVARKLAQGLPGLALAAITTRDRGTAHAWRDPEGISRPLASI